MSPAKTTQMIVNQLAVRTRVGPRNQVLLGSTRAQVVEASEKWAGQIDSRFSETSGANHRILKVQEKSSRAKQAKKLYTHLEG